MRLGVSRLTSVLLFGVGVAVAPACAQMLGIEDLDLQPPDASVDHSLEAAAGFAGAAGEASVEAEPDVSQDPTVDPQEEPDVTAEPPEDVIVETQQDQDAPSDVAVEEAAADVVSEDVSTDVISEDAVQDAPSEETGIVCPIGLKPCGQECVSKVSVATGCGSTSCDPCAFDHASAMCESVTGLCAIQACVNNYKDCNDDPVDGCEGAINSDPNNCGVCKHVCVYEHAAPSCVAGACAMGACENGYTDCDGLTTNGCETHTAADIKNCGKCGLECILPHGNAVCDNGVCKLDSVAPCLVDYLNCDSQTANGCEVNRKSDVNNCGACGQLCTSDAGLPMLCIDYACVKNDCTPPSANCDTSDPNCEANLSNEANNCGGCGVQCSFAHAGASCVLGTCTMGACDTGYGNCDGSQDNGCEVDLKSSQDHCGTCTTPCLPGTNETATCDNGQCTRKCVTGFGDCNSTPGCETDLLNGDPSNCSACGTVCDATNGTAFCQNGNCTIVCSLPFGDCDPQQAGCETNLNTTTNHCGFCSKACGGAHGTPSCLNGQCQLTCDTGYSNCNGNLGDGCEALTSNDALNCGDCGRVCASTNVFSLSCSQSTCAPTCVKGYASCSSPTPDNGCELPATNDDHNCGSCGMDCTTQGGGLVCSDGLCGCSTAQQCNSNGANGICLPAQKKCQCNNKLCARGEGCKYNSGSGKDVCSCNGGDGCNPSQVCCPGSGGCRALNSDASHCGACGRACPPGFKCNAGECGCDGDASCNAGSEGTCDGSLCTCGEGDCVQGQRCLVDGSCG